jgi:hypothetical protein
LKSAILLVFASILVYTGILTFDRDSAAGIACLALGIILSVNPLLRLIRQFGILPARKSSERPRSGRKKSHLKIVKPDDDKRPPTIH